MPKIFLTHKRQLNILRAKESKFLSISNPDERTLGIVLDALIRVLKLRENANDKVKKEFNKLYASVDKILVRKTLTGPYEIVDDIIEDVGGNIIVKTLPITSLGIGEYVKVEIRINGMNNKDRSGDIVLIMNDTTTGGVSYRYTTGVACKAWHGSLNQSDSYVPLIVAYPGGKKGEIETLVNIACPAGCEGNWRVTDLIKNIIEKQYPIQ